MKKKGIKAVHEQDLDAFLKSLDLLDVFLNRELRCHFCGANIDRANFRCVFPLDNKVRVCCDSLNCFQKVESLMLNA